MEVDITTAYLLKYFICCWDQPIKSNESVNNNNNNNNNVKFKDNYIQSKL
jgi:hypothetical protein